MSTSFAHSDQILMMLTEHYTGSWKNLLKYFKRKIYYYTNYTIIQIIQLYKLYNDKVEYGVVLCLPGGVLSW